MKKYILLLIVAAIALADNRSRVLSQDAALRLASGEVGRYQLVAAFAAFDGRLYLLDTATGRCWSRTPASDWREEGIPTQARTRRTERQAKRSAPTLDLPAKSVEISVIQREERAIPGSDGSVRIRLGDITDGQVLLSVVSAEEDSLLERTSVAQGDTVVFSVGMKKYTIQIKELRNILIGDDFAKITVAEADEESSPKKRRSPDREP